MKHNEYLVNNGADFFVNCMKKQNYFISLILRPFHFFGQFLNQILSMFNAADPNPQNFGFNFS